MHVVRAAAPNDLDDLVRVASYLDSVNLPSDRERLGGIIARSVASFSAELPVNEREYLFVLADDAGRVVGSSMIFAQHGSRRAPHVFFDVIEEERYSASLDRHFHHKVLRIGFNFKGLTELGGLALLPSHRSRPEQWGKLLAYVRFLFVALNRPVFCEEMVSELMPPLEPDGTSHLWEALGRHFTGLSYQEADRLSRENKEFIRALFPEEPIYAAILPAAAQALIGVVGPATKGVETLLRRIGFRYAERIDPFDGGPHFHARTDEVSLVRAARQARLATPPPGQAPDEHPSDDLIVSRQLAGPPYFIAVRSRGQLAAPVPPDDRPQVTLPSDARRALGAEPGDAVGAVPLQGPST